MKRTILIVLIIFLSSNHISYSSQLNTPKIDIERLLDAIYISEGRELAKVPYGLIYNEYCTSEPGWCRYMARSIVEIHLTRCKPDEEPIPCIGRQYAPVSHHKMNNNWVKNVSHFYEM